MGVFWAHMSAIGCIVLNYAVAHYDVLLDVPLRRSHTTGLMKFNFTGTARGWKPHPLDKVRWLPFLYGGDDGAESSELELPEPSVHLPPREASVVGEVHPQGSSVETLQVWTYIQTQLHTHMY